MGGGGGAPPVGDADRGRRPPGPRRLARLLEAVRLEDELLPPARVARGVHPRPPPSAGGLRGGRAGARIAPRPSPAATASRSRLPGGSSSTGPRALPQAARTRPAAATRPHD